MMTRMPCRAGMFYPAERDDCEKQAQAMLNAARLPAKLPPVRVGVAPHAGWSFSGELAALTVKALFAHPDPPKTVLLLGADHVGEVQYGEVYARGRWQTPLGYCGIDDDLATALLDESELLRDNPYVHAMEHSLEVQTPLIQLMDPTAMIVPISVPFSHWADDIGDAVGKVLAAWDYPVAVLASSDLSHTGGHFGHPQGYGQTAEAHADENDHLLLHEVCELDAAETMHQAVEHRSACGAGALVAAIHIAKAIGATRGKILSYTNSYRITHERYPNDPDDTTVGYASVVFM